MHNRNLEAARRAGYQAGPLNDRAALEALPRRHDVRWES
jgi:hypothetical protein